MFDIIRPFISRHECPDCFSLTFSEHYLYHEWDNFSLYCVSLFLILRENFFFCYCVGLAFAILTDLIVRYYYVHSHKHYTSYYFNHYCLSEENRGGC